MTQKPSPSPGTLPTQLARLTALASLNVRRNALSGRLPSQLGQGLHVLQYLYLDHNRLSGTLPASLYVQKHRPARFAHSALQRATHTPGESQGCPEARPAAATQPERAELAGASWPCFQPLGLAAPRRQPADGRAAEQPAERHAARHLRRRHAAAPLGHLRQPSARRRPRVDRGVPFAREAPVAGREPRPRRRRAL